MYYSGVVGLAMLVLVVALIFLGYSIYTRQKQEVLTQIIPQGTDEAIGTVIPVCVDQPVVPTGFTFDQPRYDSVRIFFTFPQPDQNYEWTLTRVTDAKSYYTTTNIENAVFTGVQEGTYKVFCRAVNACGGTLSVELGTITTCSSTLPALAAPTMTVGSGPYDGDQVPVTITFTTLPDPDVTYFITLFAPYQNSSPYYSINKIYDVVKFKPENPGQPETIRIFVPNPCTAGSTCSNKPIIARITPMTKCALGTSVYAVQTINRP